MNNLYLLPVNYTCWKPFGSRNIIIINKNLIAETVKHSNIDCFQYARLGLSTLQSHPLNAPLKLVLLLFLVLLREKLRNSGVKNMAQEHRAATRQTTIVNLYSGTPWPIDTTRRKQLSEQYELGKPNIKDRKRYIFKYKPRSIKVTFCWTPRPEEEEASRLYTEWVCLFSMWKSEVVMLMKFRNDPNLRCC